MKQLGEGIGIFLMLGGVPLCWVGAFALYRWANTRWPAR